MARQRKWFWVNRSKGVVVGRFHELMPGNVTGNPPMSELCAYEEARFEVIDGTRRERSEAEFEAFLKARFDEKLQQLRKKRSTGALQVAIQTGLDLWLKEIAATRSGRTLEDYQLSASFYLEALGDHLIAQVPTEAGALLTGWLFSQGQSQRTVYKHIANLQTFFNWAQRNRLMKELIRLPKPRKILKEPRVYTKGQLKEIEKELQEALETAETEYRRMLRLNQLRAYRMAVFTAMRGGEIWSLKLANIRLEQRVLLIRDVPEIGFFVKGRREEQVPISGDLSAFLALDLALRDPKEIWYLDDGRGNQPYVSEAKLARPFSEINRKLGIEGVKPLHGIRATVITHLLEQNEEITKVQKLARHRMITTTKGYQNTQGLTCLPLVDAIQLLK